MRKIGRYDFSDLLLVTACELTTGPVEQLTMAHVTREPVQYKTVMHHTPCTLHLSLFSFYSFYHLHLMCCVYS